MNADPLEPEKSVYAELLIAGAPALPDGYFYRIKEAAFGGFEVQLRRHNPRLGSRCLTERNIYLPDIAAKWRREDRDADTSDVAIFAATCARVWELHEELVAERIQHLGARRFVGDHP